MNIRLQQVVPIPLMDKIRLRRSDIWNCDVMFAKGDRVKIKAPSGTGKTTLVHTIYKMRQDYSGELYYDQSSLRSISANALSNYRQQSISVIFQDMRLFGNLTVRENIELKRVMYKPIYEPPLIDSMAERLGITHILQQTAATCSYGEQQRVAIIRSLVQPFEWLIMDEPFSHLDEANALKAASLIDEECKKRSAGFILTDLDDDQHFDYSSELML
ncbi:MAG: ATP-binding cassette domain-containing protein [Chitinophagaceae bacterium]